MLYDIWIYSHNESSVISINKMNVFVNGYVWWSVNILMLIWAYVFIYQNDFINEEKCHLSSLYQFDRKQLWWWYCTVSEYVSKFRNRTLIAVMCTCDRYAVCGFSSRCVSLYPRVCLSGESYCGEANRLSANQEIPALCGNWTAFTTCSNER